MCWLADIMATMMTKLLRLSTVSGKNFDLNNCFYCCWL
ncbi:unnamed protein product [Brassica oleracea]